MTRVCRLTPEGISAMAVWLDGAASGSDPVVPGNLLVSGPFAAPIEPRLDVQLGKHGSRFQFAAWLDDAVMVPTSEALARDVGFWAWLTLAHFDEVCPRTKDGTRGIGALARYIPSFDEWKRYYRHLLAGPWMIYRAHREQPQDAMALLTSPLAKPGEVVEQFAARMEWVTNPSVMQVVTQLYLDRSKGVLRRGAGSKGRGSARRLAAVLWQFDRTFDLYSVPPSQLIGMLPAEFEKYKSKSA